ncbi:MAG: DamX protein [Idiomarinaceae bacterium HL-53]|nr:MAG: DamX protein [Idiomarinaceae bacterium HL-53]CUS47925.1 AAA domain-containing protein [Idiomarinaceae bacterium HL-53]
MQNAVTEAVPLAIPVNVVASQRKVLEQLHYLTTFRNQMVILAGPQGAGKSTLLEVFLEQASDYANLAYLNTPQKLQVEQIRQRLLQQITSVMRMPADASLSKTIRRALPSEPQHLMIVVDDAEQLPPVILDELQELVLHSRFTAGRHRISVIVSGSMEWAARQKKRLPSNQTDAPEIITIPEFTDAEALQFAKQLLTGHEKGKALAADTYRVQAALGTSLSYPGTIRDCLQALVAPIPTTRYHIEDDSAPVMPSKAKRKAVRTQARPQGQRPLKIILLGAIFMTLITSAWMYRGELETLLANATTDMPERFATETTESGTESRTESASETAIEETATPIEFTRQFEPTDFLNPVLEQGESQLTMSYEEALPRLTEAARAYVQKGDLQIGLYRFEDNSVPAENIEIVSEAVPETSTAAVSQISEVREAPAINQWLEAHDNALVVNQSADRVTLQLAAFSSESATQTFLSQQANRDNLMVYHTLRNGGDWFVVITGNYASIAEARVAINNLPTNQQALSPWAKPYEWIHQELAVVDLIKASN